MPTLRGWTGLALGVACIIAGRILGLQELYIVGGVLLALVIAAIIIAVMRPLSLAVARSVNPPRLHVGAVGRVELALRNGSSRSPVMRMTDHVEGTSGAQLYISPLTADEVTKAAYRLPTERRGIVTLGPVKFEATDPFGLAIRRLETPSPGRLVVYPEVVPIPPTPPSPATERRSLSDTPEFQGGRSEEFHALRQYVPGDDIRRINWSASARHDDLIVREDESPTQNHLTVIFDNAALPSVEATDKATSVAASVLSTMGNRADPFRLITLDGHDTGYVHGRSGVETALSALAIVDAIDPSARTAPVPRSSQGAAVVVTTAQASVTRQELSGFSRVMYITLQPSVWDVAHSRTESLAEAKAGEIRIQLGSMDDLASVWSRAITTLMAAKR